MTQQEEKAALHITFSHDQKDRIYNPPDQETRRPETLLAQTASVTSAGGITVAALPALNDEEFFQSLPKPIKGLEAQQLMAIAGLMSAEKIAAQIYQGKDHEAVWKQAEKLIDKNRGVLEQELGPVDIQRLTPWQAIYLAQWLTSANLEYDYSLLEEQEFIDDIQDSKLREKLLRFSPVDHLMWVRIECTKTDRLLPSQLLSRGSGLCRHYAKVAAAIFYAFKTHQEATWRRLDGVEMLYYTPNYRMEAGISDDDHAYNIVVILAPRQKEGNELILSVADPTWTKIENGRADSDQTYRRLSTALTFLSSAGSLLGVEDPYKEAGDLAMQLLDRMEVPIHDPALLSDYFSVLGTANDARRYPLSNYRMIADVARKLPKADIPVFLLTLNKAPAAILGGVGGNDRLPNIWGPLYDLYHRIDYSQTEDAGILAQKIRADVPLATLAQANHNALQLAYCQRHGNIAIMLQTYYQMGDYPKNGELEALKMLANLLLEEKQPKKYRKVAEKFLTGAGLA